MKIGGGGAIYQKNKGKGVEKKKKRKKNFRIRQVLGFGAKSFVSNRENK